MKVSILSYPMLFQASGGLQIQIIETIMALQKLGCDAKLMDPAHERLTDYDICHVFAAINGNFRIVEYCNSLAVPVVVSPLIRPHWTKGLSTRASLATRITGRLTGWNVRTEFEELSFALKNADLLIALGHDEKAHIEAAFGIPGEKVKVVPNGVPERFFNADPTAFLDAFKVEPGFVLNVASVNHHKNQLTLAKAMAGSGVPVVIIGPCRSSNQPYLADVLSIPGTRYVGLLKYDDPLLASAYAAAGVFCLPSNSEVMPLSVLEALAAGTPVVLTRNHCMDLNGMRGCVMEIAPHSARDIRDAITQQLAAPNTATLCKDSVARATWESVAELLSAYYQRLVSRPGT